MAAGARTRPGGLRSITSTALESDRCSRLRAAAALRQISLALPFLIFAAGCTGDGSSSVDASSGAQVRYDTGAEAGFFDFPWPSDVRLRDDGTVDASRFPNPKGLGGIQEMIDLAGSEVRNFSQSGGVFFRFDRSFTGVEPVPDPMATTREPSPYFLVNLRAGSHYGVRSPVWLDYHDAADSYRPGQLLAMLPVSGVLLERESTYGAVVLRDAFARPEDVSPSPALAAALAGRNPSGDENGAELAASLAPLASYLRERGIDARDVIGATVFSTGDRTTRLTDFVHQVERLPTVTLDGPLTSFYDHPDYCALQGSYRVPVYQNGTAPYILSGGVIQARGADHTLVEQSRDRVPFVVSFPKTPMPAGGFPLFLYVHGTGGTSDQVVTRGPVLVPGGDAVYGEGPAYVVALRGYGAGSSAGTLNPERIGDLSAGGYIAYNFTRPYAMRDNFAQMILDQIEFLKVLLALRVDASQCPGTDASASGDGTLRFDPTKVAVSGQSLGSYLTGMLASLHDGFTGAVLTGAGGGWGEFALGPQDPPLSEILKFYLGMGDGEALDLFHPVISIFDLTVGEADNVNYVRRIRTDPPAERHIPHVLVIEGTYDLQTTANLQRGLVAAIGVDMLGDSQTTDPYQRLEDAIRFAGNDLLTTEPVRGNETRPDGSPLTYAVVRYEKDPIREGHYVSFQRDDAKHDYGCFLETLLTDPQGVPSIIRGSTFDGPCP